MEMKKKTAGWLAENADHIKVGATHSGNQGAWLVGRDDKTLVPLAIRDYNHDGEVQLVVRSDSGYAGMTDDVYCGPCSEACWDAIYKFAVKAAQIMEELFEHESNVNVELYWAL